MRSERERRGRGRSLALLLAIAAGDPAPPDGPALVAQLQGALLVADRPGPAAPLPRLLLLYVGAPWCAPCHALTPVVRELRATLRQAGARTEVVMVSLDATPSSLQRELRRQDLSWPAIDPRQAPRLPALQRVLGPAPPQLVLIEDGRILAQAWQGWRYPGPRPVLRRWIAAACAQPGSRCHGDEAAGPSP